MRKEQDKTSATPYARKKSLDKYRQKVRRFTFQLSLHDNEVREWFEQQPEKGAYLKKLILADKENRLQNGPSVDQTDHADDRERSMAGDYEITLATRLGGRELILGYDPNNKEYKYMTAFRQTNLLGDIVYPKAIGSDDYFTVMKVFIERLQEQEKKVEQFREARSLPFATLGREHCRKRGEEENLTGKLIILAPSSLAPEYRTADCQLGFATGGFGCSPGAGGRAVYFRELYSGEECRWNIGDVLGIADTEKLPEWAKEKLTEYEKRRTAPKKERGEAR